MIRAPSAAARMLRCPRARGSVVEMGLIYTTFGTEHEIHHIPNSGLLNAALRAPAAPNSPPPGRARRFSSCKPLSERQRESADIQPPIFHPYPPEPSSTKTDHNDLLVVDVQRPASAPGARRRRRQTASQGHGEGYRSPRTAHRPTGCLTEPGFAAAQQMTQCCHVTNRSRPPPRSHAGASPRRNPPPPEHCRRHRWRRRSRNTRHGSGSPRSGRH